MSPGSLYYVPVGRVKNAENKNHFFITNSPNKRQKRDIEVAPIRRVEERFQDDGITTLCCI
jgi:hypothetical protein